MSDDIKTEYKPYWTIRGILYHDLTEVERLVRDGAVAIEISAESQRLRAENIARYEKQKADAIEQALPPYRVSYEFSHLE